MTKAAKMFRYWMIERERIRRQRSAGEPWPWTEDQILQTYRFCNVFRRDDKVTQHYLRWIKPLLTSMNRLDLVVFNTAMYRLFNRPETLDHIGLVNAYHGRRITMKLRGMQKRKDKIFTGAFMVTGKVPLEIMRRYAPRLQPPINKVDLVSVALYWLWNHRDEITSSLETRRLEKFVGALSKTPMFGRFLSYEVATDLTYHVMARAKDQDTWAHVGPGAIKGLNFYHGRQWDASFPQKEALPEMREILQGSGNWWPWPKRRLHLREIEHSLCEFCKYMKVLHGLGRPREKYKQPERRTET